MLQLPGAMSRPEVSSGNGYTLPFALSKAEYQALKKLGTKHSATVLMLITAAFKVVYLQQMGSVMALSFLPPLRLTSNTVTSQAPLI